MWLWLNKLLLTGVIEKNTQNSRCFSVTHSTTNTLWDVCIYVYVLLELLWVRHQLLFQQRQRPVIIQTPSLSLSRLFLRCRWWFSPEFQPKLIDRPWRENEVAAFWCAIVICIITIIQQGLNWKHEEQRPVSSTTLMCEPQ